MFNRYFQQELSALKDLGEEFSRAHPTLAPMLSGPSVDPDVERLLEGVAFLTALLREKLDDEFPEIIHELMQLIWPHYLRPIPSSTIVVFSPKAALKESLTIPAGIHVASIPIEGTSCLFKTCYGVELHPLKHLEASFVELPGRPPAIKLVLELSGIKISDWHPKSLRFFLAGDYHTATDLYLLMRYYLREILITPLEQGVPLRLSPKYLRPVGFNQEQGLIPYPSPSFPGYRALQEYFVLPEKFLFLDLVGWERWQNGGDGSRFEISFELERPSLPVPQLKKTDFVLFATPVINIFPHDADPIRLDHRRTEYLVRPSGKNAKHYEVYSIEEVSGFTHGTAEERTYRPFEFFAREPQSVPVYHVTMRRSPVRSGLNVYLSVAYPPEAGTPVSETLSIQVLCTNGSLPDHLQLGDISIPTSSSPEFVEFANILPVKNNIQPPLGKNLLWRLLSHLSLNYLSLANAENLKALLGLYVFSEGPDRTAILANQRRISGIQDVEARPRDRLISGIIAKGQEITVRVRHDHFASQGDLFLFGSVLDHFLGSYASINTFTTLILEEVLKGDVYQWPAKLGDRPLI